MGAPLRYDGIPTLLYAKPMLFRRRMTRILKVIVFPSICHEISDSVGQGLRFFGAFALCLIARRQIVGAGTTKLLSQTLARSELIPAVASGVYQRPLGALAPSCGVRRLHRNNIRLQR